MVDESAEDAALAATGRVQYAGPSRDSSRRWWAVSVPSRGGERFGSVRQPFSRRTHAAIACPSPLTGRTGSRRAPPCPPIAVAETAITVRYGPKLNGIPTDLEKCLYGQVSPVQL